ncbi:uncharacterized protein LOC108922240 [Scleropages formosus]|nr:uncharacterized protein LOC108922240 [Scleropages formosus]
MKVFVVLALAVFTGCHANLLWADEPKPQLELVKDAFWDYVAKATHTAEDTLKMIRESQLGQEVNARIAESADAASQYTMALRSQLTPLAQDMLTKISAEAELLRKRLAEDLSSARSKLEPFAEDLKAKIQERVELLKQEMAPYAESLDTETLKATVLQKSEELKGSLEQSVKELQSKLGPYTEDLREKVDQRLQEFQKSVAPMAENIQNQMIQRAKMVQQSLAPYAEDLRAKLNPYAQDLKTQLTSLWESFTKRTSGGSIPLINPPTGESTLVLQHHQMRTTLKKVNAGKTAGPDGVPGWPERIGSHTSSTLILNTGTPQGCVLSPMLFTLFTHDCNPLHTSNSIIIFAGDTTIVGLISDNEEMAYRLEVEHLAGLSAPYKHQQPLADRHTETGTPRETPTAMKVFVVLALAVFSGSHANLLWADEPKTQLEQVKDAFWDYVAKATQTTEETLKMVKESQLGQALNARITESADVASQYTVALRSQLTPLAQDMLSKVFQEAELLRERLAEDVSSARSKLEPYTEDLKVKIQERVEQLKQEMAPYAESLDTETLKATVLQKSEELKGSLEQSVKELQSKLGPYTEDLREKVDQRLQEFQKSVAPMAENIQNQMVQRAEMMQKSLIPYAEDLREKLDPYAQDLKAKLAALWESFAKGE